MTATQVRPVVLEGAALVLAGGGVAVIERVRSMARHRTRFAFGEVDESEHTGDLFNIKQQ